jgi:hypothetical protein
MHAVSMPWQTLKGISIKNIYVCELSYSTTTKLYKFNNNNNNFWRLQSRITLQIRSIIKNRLYPMNQGPRGDYLMKKPESQKSRGTVPLKNVCALYIFLSVTSQCIGHELLRFMSLALFF